MTFPTPKFQIDQRVYVAVTELRTLPQVCPDCLGSLKWAVRTPAGESFEIDCGTCTYDRLVPQAQYFPGVRVMTVGSVRVDTAERYGRPVSYMMQETGVGTGTIWYEDDVNASEDRALERAKVKASEQNEAMRRNAEHRRASTKSRPRRKPAPVSQ